MKTRNPRRDFFDYCPSVEEILEKGKTFEWKRPEVSPCCQARFRWHGWRERWWGTCGIFVRRVKCSACKKTFTLRPQELWPRFQATAEEITQACELRITQNQWAPGFSRGRIRWWVRVAQKLLSGFTTLVSAIRKMLEHFPFRAPLSRYWLTHHH